jgi:hypothetical protein
VTVTLCVLFDTALVTLKGVCVKLAMFALSGKLSPARCTLLTVTVYVCPTCVVVGIVTVLPLRVSGAPVGARPPENV